MKKIELIKAVREKTGLGLAEAQRVLLEADYNLDKALEIAQSLPERAGAEGKEGYIFAYTHGGLIGVLVELSCESDFVSRSAEFRGLGKDLCLHVAADYLFGKRLESEGNDWDQPFVKDASLTPRQVIKNFALQMKENIHIKRAVRWQRAK